MSPQRIVTTQDASGAVILWDATPYVQRLARDGTTMHDGLAQIKAAAIRIFVKQAPALARLRHHLRVVVSFVQSGAPDPRYQTRSFGIKTIMTVEGNISSHMRFPKNWTAELSRGIPPPGVKIEMASDLPFPTQ
ncbi:MAG: hypothetical protein JO033_12535 [Acidobacteriaceae bacterium]|nr:hypothetical protein [Acidobacteriaceae bacterium]